MCIGMRSGNFSRYYNISSVIHSLNPLCKILALLLFVIMSIMASNIREMCCLFIVLVFIISLSNVSIIKYIRPIYSMRFLFILVFIINILFGVSVYDSFIIICRICLVVMYSSVLLFTTTTNGIAYGFSSLFRPLGVFGFPVYRVSMAIALSLNFVPNLFFESNRIIKSQISRGLNYNGGSLFDRIVIIKNVFIPMFVNSIKRSYRISDAMKVKSFGFNCDRSSIKSFRWSISDFYMITCHLMVFVFVLIREVVM